MFKVGQQVLCWSCCKVLMKALDGCPNLPWGSAHLPGRKPWDQHVLITGASWKGWITSHMQSSLCHICAIFFFSLWTAVNGCLLHSIPPTPNPVVTVSGTNVGPQLRTPGVEVTPIFHTFSSFSSPCFLFTFIASLFCSVTFYTMFVPKVEAT